MSDSRRLMNEETTARSPGALSHGSDAQTWKGQQESSAGGLPSLNNHLQTLGLNYAFNVLQNPLTSILLQNTTKDLMALSKSLLLFSSITNSADNVDKLANLLLDNNDPSKLTQSQRGTMQTRNPNAA